MTLLTERELAKRLNLSPRTLQCWRRKGIGPRWIKLEGAVRYDAVEIEVFLKSGIRGPEAPPEMGPEDGVVGAVSAEISS